MIRAPPYSGTRPARGTPGYKARPDHHPGPTDRRLRPTGAPEGGATTSASPRAHRDPPRHRPRRVGQQRPRRQGLPRLRPASAPVAGTAMSTLPGFIGLRPADAPEVESSIGHVWHPRAVRPARASEAVTPTCLRSEETRHSDLTQRPHCSLRTGTVGAHRLYGLNAGSESSPALCSSQSSGRWPKRGTRAPRPRQ